LIASNTRPIAVSEIAFEHSYVMIASTKIENQYIALSGCLYNIAPIQPG
jgi:hypothetical protein